MKYRKKVKKSAYRPVNHFKVLELCPVFQLPCRIVKSGQEKALASFFSPALFAANESPI
jgi:hypothetical protein